MKKKFLSTLETLLAPLEKEEREEILRFYEERFETSVLYEGKTEQEVIDELESPADIARNVLEAYGHRTNKVNKAQPNQVKDLRFWGCAVADII